LNAGDVWYGILEEKVKSSDTFIILLGKTTLESQYVRSEIQWALNTPNTTIIPILHNDFDEAQLEGEFRALKHTNYIRIQTENAIEYNSMLNQLLTGINLIS